MIVRVVVVGDFGDVDGDGVFIAHGLDFGGPAVSQEVLILLGEVVVGVVSHEGHCEGR